ncbi:histidine--tRNA ligase [Tenacibaculum sp. 190524A02b]|uniref:Histidine--tRNA ligase n=1 Tax=Tenacibaculum vairaonense TaxID=3137860 RepID=A0ABM9PS28_9FLAO
MKPSIPKGTRDFSSTEVAKRNYIFSTIKHSFENFGFQPIETPSFENSSTLMGKYGEEGDRLIFKILNSGDYLKKVDVKLLEEKNSQKVIPSISEKALRYDLTVPFARYVVQHQNEITFPFKRYQIQPVWRADRPQKGRFREFYQCDADVVGSKSLWQEVEFVQLYDTVFSKLGLQGTTIKINNRKILSGIAEVIGAKDKLIDFTVALDKLDKIGKEGVVKEMLEKGISEEAIAKVDPLFSFTGSNNDKLASLQNMLEASEEGLKGVEELRFIVEAISELGLSSASLELDVTLARGLNYYTGAIYEVAAPREVKIGSIGGGGRYDDLTGIFGMKDVSGVGISFGLDRIYLVMEELGLFETVELPKPKVLFLNFDGSESLAKIKAIKVLRGQNIKSELYPDLATSNNQQKKQWKYATNREIEFVVSNMEDDKFRVKNMQNREENLLTLNEIVNLIK